MIAFAVILLMFVYAIAAYWINRRLEPHGLAARVNEFVGVSVGGFAVALLIATFFTSVLQSSGAFPDSRSAGQRRDRVIDSLRVRVEVLESRRLP